MPEGLTLAKTSFREKLTGYSSESLSGFSSESCPASNRNGVRLHVGIPVRIGSESALGLSWSELLAHARPLTEESSRRRWEMR